MSVVERRYIDILIIMITFSYIYTLFLAVASLLLCSFLNVFSFLFMLFLCNIYIKRCSKNI